jgi:hypothetical protein
VADAEAENGAGVADPTPADVPAEVAAP